jgi:hypothetical protein
LNKIKVESESQFHRLGRLQKDGCNDAGPYDHALAQWIQLQDGSSEDVQEAEAIIAASTRPTKKGKVSGKKAIPVKTEEP